MEEKLQIQVGIIRDLKNLKEKTQTMSTIKAMLEVLMVSNQDKPKETHQNSLIVITFLKTITGNGE